MLSIERKAELFDYLASRLVDMKLQLDFGGTEWMYLEHNSPEELAELLEQAYEWEEDAKSEEVEEEDDAN